MKPRQEHDVYDDFEKTREAYQQALDEQQYERWSALVDELLSVINTRREFDNKTLFTIDPNEALQNSKYEASILLRMIKIKDQLNKFKEPNNKAHEKLTSVNDINFMLNEIVEKNNPIMLDNADHSPRSEQASPARSRKNSLDLTKALSENVKQPIAKQSEKSQPKTAEPDAPPPLPKTPSPDVSPRFLGQPKNKPQRPKSDSPDESPTISPKSSSK